MISLSRSEMPLSPCLARVVGRTTELDTRFKLIFVAVTLTLGTPVSQAQMLSQCVKDGTVIHLQCPVDSFDEDEDYITWMSDFEYETDYDYDLGTGGLNAYITASWSGNVAGYDVEEITCQLTQSHFEHAVIIVADAQNPVLPIQPYLEKGSGHTLSLVWDYVYYNYAVRVSVTDGYQLTEHLYVEVHKQLVIMSLNLTGFECKNVDVEVSLPGNCEDKRISGVLLITPMQFQGNLDCQTLYNDNGIAEQVLINFTLPDLCLSQTASYILSFDDGSEVWSTQAYLKTITTPLVLKTINVETELRREENYTLNVTIITDYANVSSITTCSTHALLGLGPIDLRVIGYNYSTVELAWSNPNVLTFSFTYLIMFHLFDSGGSINPLKESFRREENPFISMDLNDFECEKIQITVAVFGDEEKAQSVNATLPSYTTTFTKELHVETSLYNNSIIREAELSFIPPPRCEFQISSYQIFITEGNKTWSNTEDPVPITDTQRLIEVEIESGFTFNTYYTATVLVFTEYANISSTKHFRFVSDPQVVTDALDTSTDEESSAALVGGVVGGAVFLLVVVLLCGFGAG